MHIDMPPSMREWELLLLLAFLSGTNEFQPKWKCTRIAWHDASARFVPHTSPQNVQFLNEIEYYHHDIGLSADNHNKHLMFLH